MKRILFLLMLCLSGLSMQAQEDNEKNERRERIKALKVAYITQEMNMDTEMAQKFWPIYNKYEQLKMALHKREHIDLDNTGSVTESKAEEMLKEYLDVEKEEYIIKKELFSNLKRILSARDIIKLHKLEADFNKKLLKEYRSRKNSGRNGSN